MDRKTNRPKTPAYLVFYLLFSTDFWRTVMGVALSIIAMPHIATGDLSAAGRAMLYVMLAAIGWTITAAPARWITQGLKQLILGGDKP